MRFLRFQDILLIPLSPSLCRTKDDDSLSLSSVEEVVNSPAPRGSQKKDEPWFSCHDSGDPNLISIEKLLLNPGRKRRPRRIVIVIRGLPGSGKTHIAKLIKDKEVEMGGSAPRILSIDDYFTSETDEIITCPQTGKDINLKSMVYEYEKEMEEKYLQYLLKSYKKTVADGYFDFIIVDAVYPKMSSVLEFTSHAKDKGFVVSISSPSCVCRLRTNPHHSPRSSLTFAPWSWRWKSVLSRTSTAARKRN